LFFTLSLSLYLVERLKHDARHLIGGGADPDVTPGGGGAGGGAVSVGREGEREMRAR